MRLPSANDIWVVDDDESTLELIHDAFERNGRRALTFNSAAKVERELDASAPAVVVMDRMLGRGRIGADL